MSACCATNCGGRRARSAGKSTSVEEVAADANHAVKQLLRACLESDEVAEALLPEVVESGAAEGMRRREGFQAVVGSSAAKREVGSGGVRRGAEPGGKTPGVRRALLAGGSPESGTGRGYLRELKIERLERERDKLTRESRLPCNRRILTGLAELQREPSSTLTRSCETLGRP